jgi:drug/metabolite transporter (DMT)-like permease
MAETKKPFNKILLYILIGLMILTGSINTIFNKILQKLYGKGVIFEQHHWIITFGMFLGELVSIFLYAYIVYKRKKAKQEEQDNALLKNAENELGQGETNEEEKKKPEENKEGEEKKEVPAPAEKHLPPIPSNFIFFITAGCDLLATTINTFGLTYLTTSMFQMMRGLELFFVCLWSRIFLKNPIYRHAYLGVGSLIFGLSLVGLNSMIFKDDNTDVAKDPLVGIILMSTSQFFSSTEYVFQEKFIKHYEVHPFQLVGFEGLWGACMYSVLLIAFQFSDCNDWSDDMRNGICFFYNETYGMKYDNGTYVEVNKTISHIEDTDFAFQQMGDNIALLFVYIFYVISIALYNIVGINLTKLVSSTARAVVDTVRTVFIWAFFLIFEPVKGTHENFYPLQFVGFCFLVFGTLVYNEIVTIPWFHLDYYTRDNIAKREKEERELREGKAPQDDQRLYLSTGGKDSTASDNPPAE